MEYKMLHTCIRVMDLEKSLKFYKQALGFEEVSRRDFPEAKFTLVYLSDQARQYELELTYNYNPDKPYEIGNGFSHIAVSVDNLEESQKRHQELGYQVTDLNGLPGQPPMFYFVTDPDGYRVEVVRANK